jgi:hypothetical protein
MNGCTSKIKTIKSDTHLQEDRNRYVSQINQYIKGKEHVMVDSVFKNLKVLGGFPAENLVFAMEAWSRALGVSCGHCHDTRDFSLDTKEKKQIARDMVIMGNSISSQLKSINGLSERPRVNCYSCHRGELKPRLRAPGQ